MGSDQREGGRDEFDQKKSLQSSRGRRSQLFIGPEAIGVHGSCADCNFVINLASSNSIVDGRGDGKY